MLLLLPSLPYERKDQPSIMMIARTGNIVNNIWSKTNSLENAPLSKPRFDVVSWLDSHCAIMIALGSYHLCSLIN